MNDDVPYGELKSRWELLWDRLNLDERTGLFETVISRYSESQRHYHNCIHLVECLRLFENLKRHINDAHLCDITEFSIWYHDIIYDTQKSGNEKESANLATVTWKKSGGSDSDADYLMNMINTTDHNSMVKDNPTAVLIDCDLAILSSPAERYLRYSDGIKKEYSHVEDVFYRESRIRVLNSFLKKKRIYRTPEMRKNAEEAARKNIMDEISRLR